VGRCGVHRSADELFLAALALHRALILAEARTFRRNLNALMDILGGKGRPSDAQTLAASMSWMPASPPGNQHPISVLHVDRAYPGEVTEARLGVAAQDHPPSLCRVSGDDQVVCPARGSGPADMG
jgi:hypothetical protein